MGLLDGINSLDQTELLRRRKLATDQATQDALAAAEHRAYAREAVAADPRMAVSLLVATPAYQAAKLIPGAMNSRSKPSLSQMGQGLLGIYEGLKAR